MQLVELVLCQEDAHHLIAELYSFLLGTDDIKQLRFLLLVFLGQIADLRLRSLVLGSKLLHDLPHGIDLLLQRGVVALDKEHLFLLLALLFE